MFVDHVLIVGNVRTQTETIERELQIKAGDPFSLAAINESQRRLTALGLFRRARITELRHGGETTRDLLVTIEEAPPTTSGYGGGVEGGRDRGRAARRRRGAARNSTSRRARSSRSAGATCSARTDRSTSSRAWPSTRRQSATCRSSTGWSAPTVSRACSTPTPTRSSTLTFEQQIRSSFNFSRRGISADIARQAHAHGQRERHLSDSAHQGVRRATAERPAADRPRVPDSSACRRFPRR